MPLNNYDSICGERQSIIVSRDKHQRREHRANNNRGCRVYQYKVDGVIIKDSSLKCDFLLLNDDYPAAYLIELKGSDIEHGIEQLEATKQFLQRELSGYPIRFRLVYSRARTQAIHSTKFKRFCRKYNGVGEFIYRENKIEEDI